MAADLAVRKLVVACRRNPAAPPAPRAPLLPARAAPALPALNLRPAAKGTSSAVDFTRGGGGWKRSRPEPSAPG